MQLRLARLTGRLDRRLKIMGAGDSTLPDGWRSTHGKAAKVRNSGLKMRHPVIKGQFPDKTRVICRGPRLRVTARFRRWLALESTSTERPIEPGPDASTYKNQVTNCIDSIVIGPTEPHGSGQD